jgi:hypothetical protein
MWKYMFEFSDSKDIKEKKDLKKKGGSREVAATFMFSTNCQGIENNVEHSKVVTTLLL